MPGSFDERMAELETMVGHGSIEASLEVDQVYAHAQHEHQDYVHPRGGQAKYLEQPWEAAGARFGETMAAGLLKPDGLKSAARAFAEDGSRMVQDHAPVEFDNLRRSGHPKVTDDGHTVYDRPPEVPRLSEADLRAERRGEIG